MDSRGITREQTALRRVKYADLKCVAHGFAGKVRFLVPLFADQLGTNSTLNCGII